MKNKGKISDYLKLYFYCINEKFSSFGKWTARWMFCIHLCRSNLFWVSAAEILWKLNPGLFLQEYEQSNASQIPTIMTLWKVVIVLCYSSWNFSSLNASYILFAGVFKYIRRKWLFRGINWENIHFCRLQKDICFKWEENIS